MVGPQSLGLERGGGTAITAVKGKRLSTDSGDSEVIVASKGATRMSGTIKTISTFYQLPLAIL